jgi:hypothetical protein
VPTINVKISTAGPREVPELKVQERPYQRENVDNGSLGGAKAEGPGAPTINMKMSMTGPREVPELEIQKRRACRARPSSRAVNGCRNIGTNA